MGIHYLSVVYTSDPQNRQTIPSGGNHPLKFPRNEQHDPWEMHSEPGAIIDPVVDGFAVIQLDVTWEGGNYIRRYGLVGDGLPYENTTDGNRPSIEWVNITPLKRGEPIAFLVGHDQPTPQQILSARLTIAINDDISHPEERKVRVRPGTDAEDPTEPEAPANPGDDGTPPVIFPE